ncbi:MAG: VWA domain-containing protein, partial [Pirellulaceae bacterium]
MRWLTILGLASCLLVVGCTKQSTQKSDPQGNGQSDRLAQNDPGKGGAAAQLTAEELFERRFPSRQIEPGMGGAGAAPEAPLAESQPAAVETWKRSKIIPNTSRLMIGDEEELPLQGMQVDVRIDGFRARVLLDCYYFNDREEPLEGTFQLRLPNEASPYYLAFGQTRYTTPDLEPQQPEFFTSLELEQSGTSPEEILDLRSDSWREPQSARVVPRQKAAFSYSEIVREQIDPALMEWSGAGVFLTSVYPLEPQNLHRIVIGYDVDLLPVGNDLVYELNLPETLKSFAVDLKVAVPDGTKVTVTPATPIAGKNGRYRFEDPKVHTIKARISQPGTLLLQGQAHQVGPLFATRFRPLPPAPEGIDGSPQAIFMVDVSLSANPDQFNVWLKIMEQILEKNRPSLKQFAVVFFNVESFWWKETYVTNTPENVAGLVAFANTLSLEAATDLGNVFTEVSQSKWLRSEGAAADLFLLSDAAVTWGEYDIYALSALLDQDNLGPLFAYRTGMTGTDTRILQHLTRETGGAVFSVVGEAELAQAARAHRQRPLEIMAVEIPGCQDLLLAGRPSVIFPGQQLQLVGRGEPKQPVEVQLTLKSGLRVTKLMVPIDAVLDSALAARSYGQVAVGQLEDLQAATEPVALAYAKHFRVAQQTCSLLMLESEEDYERFNIKPQEDGALIKSTLASTTVANALDQLTTALGDPKERFFTWLKLFEERSEEGFEISEEFRAALKRMPRESFAVLVKPLECKERMR